MNITFSKSFWHALSIILGVACLAITVLGMIFASVMSPVLFAIGLGAQAASFFGSFISGCKCLLAGNRDKLTVKDFPHHDNDSDNQATLSEPLLTEEPSRILSYGEEADELDDATWEEDVAREYAEAFPGKLIV